MNTSEDNLDAQHNGMTQYLDSTDSALNAFSPAELKVSTDYAETEFYESMLLKFKETLSTPLL